MVSTRAAGFLAVAALFMGLALGMLATHVLTECVCEEEWVEVQ